MLWRASLTLRSCHRLTKHTLALTRALGVCLGACECIKSTWTSWAMKASTALRSSLRSHWDRIQPQLTLEVPNLDRQSRFNTHSPAASAANAGGFLQTSLSEVTRRSTFRCSSAVLRRVTPDRVLAVSEIYRAGTSDRAARAHPMQRCSGNGLPNDAGQTTAPHSPSC